MANSYYINNYTDVLKDINSIYDELVKMKNEKEFYENKYQKYKHKYNKLKKEFEKPQTIDNELSEIVISDGSDISEEMEEHPSSSNTRNCYGCKLLMEGIGGENQLAHMEYGGCLYNS